MEGVFDEISSVDFANAAWHLHADWIPQAHDTKYRIAKAKVQIRKLPPEMQLLLHALRDIATGEKHCFLRDAKEEAKKVITDIEPGETSNWYAYFFHERILGVTTKDHYYFSVRKLRDLVLDYLAWVFDDSVPAKDFPGELLGNIWWCRPANRSSQTPPLGAIIPSGGDEQFVTIKPESS